MISTALTIAGSDPSGGAGIQADLKTFSALGVYGMSALTALTVQNTQGVSGVHLVPASFVQEQIKGVFADITVHAIKIGMIATADIACAVAETLRSLDASIPIVLDPVMVAKGGAPLLPSDAVGSLTEHLLPLANIITPNLEESAALLGTSVARNRKEMLEQGRKLRSMGVQNVLLKGGHLSTSESPDLFVGPSGEKWFEAKRINTQNTHGTGCTLSSALAAHLALSLDLREAISASKKYVQGAILNADKLSIGHGHGPTHHFHSIW
jgi:hydroxymethylpyrimidine/phosphomethylpyrimidine kinase